ncbi:MAG: 23S rRNA (uracil(1939)-C(5))-methyltransferase RlmD [Dehalococcoidia bacterium]
MSRRGHRYKEPSEPTFITVRVESLVFGGAGLAHAEDGRVVFVSFAAPGELVEAQVEREYPDYIQAVTRRVIEPSSDRVEPPCPLFGECGGCQLQHMNYPAQLAAKEAVVREQLRRIGRLDDAVVRPIVGAANPWAYRNHLRFSTGKKYGDVGYIGRKGIGLLKVEHCPIADDWVNELLPMLQGHGSGLHQVQVRHSAETGTFLVNPEIPGIPVETGQKAYVEELAGRRFDVSASAFFQVNHAQAEQMVRLVGEALPQQGELLIDGFAGVGTFAVLFADRFERVLAIEESNSAARDSERNLAQAANVEMLVGKVEDVLPSLEERPDAIVLDPPRPGCAPPVMRAILEFQPASVVYVSCNPATLARDLRILVDGGYVLDWVTPLDMFPQTGHIECVSRLTFAGPRISVVPAGTDETDAEVTRETSEGE